jgi:hypothetical protein
MTFAQALAMNPDSQVLPMSPEVLERLTPVQGG